MADNFNEILNNFTLNWEGRISENTPGDPGKATHWGITQADYDAFRREHGLPLHDVFSMTPGEVTATYMEHYEYPLHYPDIPDKVFAVMFDAAVNLGVSRSVGFLQGVLGITQDGVFGPQTLAALKNYLAAKTKKQQDGQVLLCHGMLVRRIDKYNELVHSNQSLAKFLPGWMNRTKALASYIDIVL
jgi:lysozyme family protein